MVSRSDTFLSSSGPIGANRQIRPTRVAIMHGSKKMNSERSNVEIHNTLVQLFSPLSARIFSVLEMTQAGMTDLISSQMYDVIGLIGDADEFDFVRKKVSASSAKLKLRPSGSESDLRHESDSLVLAFAPNTHFKDVNSYLRISDAVVLCDIDTSNWQIQVSQVAYHFFESLVVPSMLNIDLADVKHIAKGIGLAFNLSDDNARKIITRLPKSCLVARSALLHFSCDPDVRLREVYSISKAIALKKGIANMDSSINSHADAKKLIRKVNVKMGIRIRDSLSRRETSRLNEKILSSTAEDAESRISLTAILFGL